MALTISQKKFAVIPLTTTWFNTNTAFEPAIDTAVHLLRQSKHIDTFNRHFCVRQTPFATTAIDLTQPEEKIVKAMEPKSCRYEIRKIRKMIDQNQDIRIAENTDLSDFIKIANDYKRIKKQKQPLTVNSLRIYLDKGRGDLINIYHNGQLLGGNFYIKDYPSRVRLLYSFNKRLTHKKLKKLSGAFMRYLHWYAITQKYKPQNFALYDFGGVDLNKNSPAYGVTKFKLSFGGTVIKEFDYVLVSNRLTACFCKLYNFIISK